ISFWTVYTHHFQNFRVLPCVCIVRKVICFFRHTITPWHLSFGVHVLICFASACNQSICDSMTRTCVYTSHTCYYLPLHSFCKWQWLVLLSLPLPLLFQIYSL